MRASILHPRDACIRVGGTHPLLVRALLFPFPIQPRQLFSGWVLDPHRQRQPLQILVVGLTVLAPHDILHGRVGFERSGIDGNRPAADQSFSGQNPDHPPEDGLVCLYPVQPPGAGKGRMVRRRFVEGVTQKAAQRQRISRAPGNATLRVKAFEVADEECPKIHARDKARPAIRALLVKLAAQRFHPGIELMLTQDLIQPVVKRIPGSLDYGARCDPNIVLPLAPLPRSHRHAEKTLTTFLRSHVLNENLLLLPRVARVTIKAHTMSSCCHGTCRAPRNITSRKVLTMPTSTIVPTETRCSSR